MSRKTKSTATKKEAKVAGASSSSARQKREQDTPTTLVPKLRFPEFRKAAGWKETQFDEVLSPIVRERKKPSEAYTGLGLRSHGKGTFLKPLADPSKIAMEYLFEVKTNDLVVNITFAWEGAVAIAQECEEGA